MSGRWNFGMPMKRFKPARRGLAAKWRKPLGAYMQDLAKSLDQAFAPPRKARKGAKA